MRLVISRATKPDRCVYSDGPRLFPDLGRRKRTGFSRKFRYKERDSSYEMADF